MHHVGIFFFANVHVFHRLLLPELSPKQINNKKTLCENVKTKSIYSDEQLRYFGANLTAILSFKHIRRDADQITANQSDHC